MVVSHPVCSSYEAVMSNVAKCIPSYKPMDVDGNKMECPSAADQVYKMPPMTRADAQCLKPLKIRGLTLKNRIIRAAAFDGGELSDMIETQVELARGGVAMSTVAYCAVSSEGRTFEHQFVMNDSHIANMKKLTDAVHSNGAKICAQLTHGGSFSNHHLSGEKNMAPSRVFGTGSLSFPREMNDDDLSSIKTKFGDSARVAIEAGFDCIEIHCGHGYLLSQFLNPSQNIRKDRYGGSPEKRAQYPLECIQECRRVVGEDFPILVKMNMHDGESNGLELKDACIAARLFAENGADMLVLSCGNVAKNGFYMLRGHVPLQRLADGLSKHHYSKGFLTRLFGPISLKPVPYEENFLRESARIVKQELKNNGVSTMICFLGGVNSLSSIEGALDEGFDCVQMARGLIRQPNFVSLIETALEAQEKELESSTNPEEVEAVDITSKCIHCNECVVVTVDPSKKAGCPYYEQEKQANKLADIEDLK